MVIVDDSLSMQYSDGRRTLFVDAVRRARAIVEALSPASELVILRGASPSVGGGRADWGDRAAALAALDALTPTARATDLPAALKRASALMGRARYGERRIYLVSDLAAHGFRSGLPSAAELSEVVLVDVTDGAPRDNHAVTDLRVSSALADGHHDSGDGQALRVVAEVHNFAAQPATLLLTLSVDGHAVASSTVTLAAGEVRDKAFTYVLPAGDGADHDLAVSLPPDRLPADDQRAARYHAARRLRVLLVDGDPRATRRLDELFFVEAALTTPLLQVSTVGVDALQGTAATGETSPLGHSDVVVLCNAKPDIDVAALRRFVESGGGPFIAMGDNVDPDAWNSAFGDLLPQPLAAVRSVGAAESDVAAEATGGLERAAQGAGEQLRVLGGADHPVLDGIGAADLGATRVMRHVLLQPRPGAARALLSLESGAPALVESRLGRGRVLLWTSTLDRDWTDLPVQPLFLPLLRQAVRYLGGAPVDEGPAHVLIGEPRILRLPATARAVRVHSPSGVITTLEELASRDGDRRSGGQWRFEGVNEPGIYRVEARVDGTHWHAEPSIDFAAAVDPAESNLRPLDPVARKLLRSGGGQHDTTPTRKVPLWPLLGGVLLALLVGEALLGL